MIGAVLAGGEGRRLGSGSKAAAQLAGRPLVEYPLEALADVCERVAVVCKRGTCLPELTGVERWDEPDEPRHPLTGIVHALETAAAPVLICAHGRGARPGASRAPPSLVRSVNTREELADAEALLAAR